MVSVTPATPADEPIIRNLLQLYAYDFAEFMQWDLPDSGRFPDEIVDGCFDGGRRHPFLLRGDDRLVGFAIVDLGSHLTDDPSVRDVAEFFVARNHRRRGVGESAARALFENFGGRWEVRQKEENSGALAFWRKVIARYTGGRFDERFCDDTRWRGPVQSFSCDYSSSRESIR